MAYRPSMPFNVPMKLLIPTWSTDKGVRKKTYPSVANGIRIFGTFKTYGGTEINANGIHVIEDTAQVETWYRPDITSGCAIALESGEIYEILGKPENIEMRNQFCVFKVSRYKGGA